MLRRKNSSQALLLKSNKVCRGVPARGTSFTCVRAEISYVMVRRASSRVWLCKVCCATQPLKSHLHMLQVKPDGVQRGLVGDIISRFEKKGFTLRGLKLFRPGKELAEEHYKDLSSKPFFLALVDYITSGPVVAMVRPPLPLPCLGER